MFTRSLKKCMYSIVSCVALIALATGCSPDSGGNNSNGNGDGEIQELSEGMGFFMMEGMQMQSLDIDIDAFIRGIKKAQAGKEAPFDKEEFAQKMSAYMQQSMQRKTVENLQEAEEFLDENKSKSGIISLEEGKLQYEVLQEGSGQTVTEDSTPYIHYEGKFINGTVFDSSIQRGSPVPLPIKSTIPGFQKGIAGMKEGEKRRLFIHPELGYGSQGRLPPNSLLIFEIEVISAEAPMPEMPGMPSASFDNPDTSSSYEWEQEELTL